MISTKELSNIIKSGEGVSVEYKTATSKLPQSLFETVCAFLNRDGGNILLGVDDAKRIQGVKENVSHNLCKQIADLSNNPTKIFPCFLLHPTVVEYKNRLLIKRVMAN